MRCLAALSVGTCGELAIVRVALEMRGRRVGKPRLWTPHANDVLYVHTYRDERVRYLDTTERDIHVWSVSGNSLGSETKYYTSERGPHHTSCCTTDTRICRSSAPPHSTARESATQPLQVAGGESEA